ncbi:MAG: hypothetical protein IRY99_13285 [Isosphaeraceae bacterium]|nr:hypothetical protein [Isosphaeraceae bacterium]
MRFPWPRLAALLLAALVMGCESSPAPSSPPADTGQAPAPKTGQRGPGPQAMPPPKMID